MLIIFDLDDTIIDTSGSILPFKLKRALQAMKEEGLYIENFLESLKMLISIDAGSESTKAALKEFLEIHDADPRFLDIGCRVVYKERNFPFEVSTTKEALSSLFELRKSHQLAIVSAGIKEIQLEKLKKASIDTSIFSRIVICEESGKRKSYQFLIEDLKVSPSRVIVCGDRIKRDLTPAKALGIKTIHMRWGRGLHQNLHDEDVDFSVSSLDQVKPILMQLENH